MIQLGLPFREKGIAPADAHPPRCPQCGEEYNTTFDIVTKCIHCGRWVSTKCCGYYVEDDEPCSICGGRLRPEKIQL